MLYNEENIVIDIQKKFNYKSYLEIGKGTGNSYRGARNFDTRISIDPLTQFNPDFLGTSDEFFKINQQYFDLIFIDGDHSYNQVKKDLDNSLKFLSPNGTIILHDTNPTEKRNCYLSKHELHKKSQGDAYKIIWDLYLNYNCNFIHVNGNGGGFTVINNKYKNHRIEISSKLKKEIDTYLNLIGDSCWNIWLKTRILFLNLKEST